jgi:hypothetical protein
LSAFHNLPILDWIRVINSKSSCQKGLVGILSGTEREASPGAPTYAVGAAAANQQDRGQTKAVLNMTHLSDGDQATLINIIRAWHQQQKQLVSSYNAAVGEANRVRDFRSYAIQVKFRHAQADLALGTAKIAKESLSPEGAKQLEQFIQAHKSAMSMNDGVI